ncbi:MAG: isocitrate lyase/phosphoenolpyruvate mutase family protein [Nannocystaceae bacterium]
MASSSPARPTTRSPRSSRRPDEPARRPPSRPRGRARALLLAGVDSLLGRLAARAGFARLWASGFGISATFCLPDVGLISMHEHLVATAAIVAAVDVPVVADVDDGFGDAINVVRTIREYEAAGVAGVCLEDHQHPKRNSLYAGFDRSLVDLEVFARKIEAACASRRDPDLVIIARTEALVAGLGVDEALRRAHAYVDAGADAILAHTKAASSAPLLEFGARFRGRAPLVAVPTTYPSADAAELEAIGVRVIIFANQGLRAAAGAMDRAYRSMAAARSLAAVEPSVSPLSEIFAVVDYEEVGRLHARYVDGSARGAESLFQRLLVANPDARADRPALRCGDLELSYGELLDLARAIARGLAAAGVRAGDRVLLRLRNSPELVALFLGVTALGAIVAPIDHDAGAERLALIVKDTAPRLCLVGEDVGEVEVGAAVHRFRIDPVAKCGVFTPALPPIAGDAPLPAVVDGADALILYSAGSTGRPKGVVLKHRQLLAIAGTLADVVGMGPEHRDLVLSPMTHSGGLQRVWATLLRGGTVVIFTGIFSLAALVDDVARHRITGFFTAPPLLRILLRADPERLAPARGPCDRSRSPAPRSAPTSSRASASSSRRSTSTSSTASPSARGR